MNLENKTGNIKSISNAFSRQQLIVIIDNTDIVGLCAYDINSDYGKINVIEIKKTYQRNGLGTILFEFVISIMLDKQVKLIEIFVHPIEIKPFWDKLKFTEFSNDNGNLYMHKTLAPEN